MTHYIDPICLGLPAKTTVEAVDRKTLAIVIKRKSRIIMADGLKNLLKANTIKTAKPGTNVILKTTTPICSKTLQLFEKKRIKGYKKLKGKDKLLL